MANHNHIEVAIKVRPLLAKELSLQLKSFWRINSTNSIQHVEGHSDPFYFDHIFGPEDNNENVFKIAKPIVNKALKGFNGTIFAYGQTSSGKTYTMLGDEKNPGVMLLAAKEIFKEIEKATDRQFLLRVGYIEIYNEKIYDLLNEKREHLKIFETSNGDVNVNCSEFIVTSENQIMDHLKSGSKLRKCGETNMNERSSRSHAIFRLTIESRETSKIGNDDAVQIGILNLVDLAGSERADQTGATGSRLIEGGHINRSLLSLGCVIKRLSENQSAQFVNYRDSKLTRILQASLGGNALTAIICAINPTAMDETNSTLNFAMRAKIIKNKPEVNEVVSDSAMMKHLEKEIRRLKSALEVEKKSKVKIVQLEQQINEERLKIVDSHSLSIARKNERRRTWHVSTDTGNETPLGSSHVNSVQPEAAKRTLNKNNTPQIRINEDVHYIKNYDNNTELNSEIILNNNQISTPKIFQNKINNIGHLDEHSNIQYITRELKELIDFTNLEKTLKVDHDVNVAVLNQLSEALKQIHCYKKQSTKRYLEQIEVDSKLEEISTDKLNLVEELKTFKETNEKLRLYNNKAVSTEWEFQVYKKKSKNREDELLTRIKEENNEIKRFCREIESLKNENINLTGSVEKLQCEKNNYNTNLDLCDQKIKELMTNFNQLQKEYDVLSSNLMESIEENEVLKNKDKENTSKIKKLNEIINDNDQVLLKNKEMVQVIELVTDLISIQKQQQVRSKNLFQFLLQQNKNLKFLYLKKVNNSHELVKETNNWSELISKVDINNKKYFCHCNAITNQINKVETENDCKTLEQNSVEINNSISNLQYMTFKSDTNHQKLLHDCNSKCFKIQAASCEQLVEDKEASCTKHLYDQKLRDFEKAINEKNFETNSFKLKIDEHEQKLEESKKVINIKNMEIEDFKAKIDTYSQKIKDLIEEISTNNVEIENFKRKSESIKQFEEAIRKKNLEIQRLKSDATKHKQEFENALLTKNSEVENFKTKLSKSDQKLEEFEKLLNRINLENEDIKNKIYIDEKTLEESKKVINKKNVEIEHFKQKVTELQADTTMKISEIKNFKSQININDQKLGELEKVVNERNFEIKNLKHMIDTCDRNLDEYGNMITQKNMEIENLKKKVDTYSHKMKDFEKEISTNNVEIENFKIKNDTIKQFEEAIRKKDLEIQSLKSDASKHNQEFEDAIAIKNSEIENFKTKLSKCDQKLEYFEIFLNKKNLENENFKKQIHTHETTIEESKMEINKKNVEIDNFKTQIDTHNQKIKELEEEITRRNFENVNSDKRFQNIKEFENAIIEKNFEIENFKYKINTQTQQLEEYEKVIKIKNSEIEKFKTKIITQNLKLSILEEEIENKSYEIKNFESKIKKLEEEFEISISEKNLAIENLIRDAAVNNIKTNNLEIKNEPNKDILNNANLLENQLQSYMNKFSLKRQEAVAIEMTQLKEKNQKLSCELDNFKKNNQKDRKTARHDCHDEKREFWNRCNVAVMTSPTDKNCACQELNSKILSSRREIVIKDSQISVLQLELKNNPFKEETISLKKKLLEKDKILHDYKKYKSNEIMQLQTNLEDINKKNEELKKELLSCKKNEEIVGVKYMEAKKICLIREKKIMKLYESIANNE